MIGIGKVSHLWALVLPLLALVTAPPARAEFECRQWVVPAQLVVKQTNNHYVTFDLQQDEDYKFHGWASYRTTEKRVVGNVSGHVAGNAFYARVLWTYSGVPAIGRYQGIIRPRTQVPVGQETFGWVGDGTTYDELKGAGAADLEYWNTNSLFRCHVDPPPPPAPKATRPDPSFDEQKKDNAALAVHAAEKSTVKPQGRVRLEGAPATTNLSICQSARAAKARNSPATAGLEKQCVASGGSLAEPIADEKLAELAAKGGPIAAADPLSAALRAQQTEGAGQIGFDIGMAAAENQTLPGPGKQNIHAWLPRDQQPGYVAAVDFSLERNRNLDRAKAGAAIALASSAVAVERSKDQNVFYQLGFDIATAIFGDPALGAQGNTATGPGSLGIRDSLSADGQRGFNAAVDFHLKQNYKPEQ